MSARSAPRLDLLPSACDRWFTCSASPRFCFENAHLLPADTSSKFSDEGTTAHEVAAAFLQDRPPNEANCPTPIDEEMRWHGWNYAEYVLGLRSGGAGESKLIVEDKQPLWYYEGRNAVIDAAMLNPESLHIVDYKYGAGVPVSPVQNRQMVIYARQIVSHNSYNGMVLPLDFPITLHIYQPRNREANEPAKTWETTWGEIKELSDEIGDHASVIQINFRNPSNAAPLKFAPSEKACRWCPAKAICPARQEDMLDGIEALTVIDDQPTPLPLPAAVPLDQLAAILRHKSKIEKWLKDAEAYAEARMSDGHEIPGFKLVLSRGGNRYWSDPKKAAELLVKETILKRAEVIEEIVRSPAAIEKLIGKKKFPAAVEALIAKPPGSPTIAPVEDERPECTIRAEHEFEVLTDEKLDRVEDY